MNVRLVRLAAIAIAASCSVILITSCSGGSQSSSSGSGAASSMAGSPSPGGMSSSNSSMPAAGGSSSSASKTTAKITIKDFKYQVPASVKPGQKITITNTDNVNHTVTADKDGAFNAVVDSNGGTKTITAPTKPGKYPFHCKYHANMHGTLVVS